LNTFCKLADLSGRRALVTGGAGHIGRVAAETLGELGALVTISDLDGAAGPAVAASLSDAVGAPILFERADLRNSADITALVEGISHRQGGLDILVHAAALVGTSDLSGWAVPFTEQTVETWDLALRINLTSAFQLAQTAVPIMRRGGSGSIVLISSIYGSLAPDPTLYAGTSMASPAAYFASKGGLEQLGRWLASMVAPEVRVNSICPGGVERGQSPVFQARYRAKTPLGRMATEDDLRGAIGYLCSDLSLYVTGQSLAVDGGISIR
jgi:NAD(P)-dependent dehydrogenase (short-subunit alcohol dehydrogenase family)